MITVNCDDEEVVQPGLIGTDTINGANVERGDTLWAKIGDYVTQNVHNGTLHRRLLIIILQGVIHDQQNVHLPSESTVFFVAREAGFICFIS